MDVLGHRGPGRDAAGTAAPGRRVPPEDCPDVGPLPWRGGIPLRVSSAGTGHPPSISRLAPPEFSPAHPRPGGDAVSGRPSLRPSARGAPPNEGGEGQEGARREGRRETGRGEDTKSTSGPSRHNLRIDGLEFTASIVDLHLPVDTALGAIDVAGPRRHFTVQRLEVADAASAQALARQGTELVLRDVQPTPVFRRVAEPRGDEPVLVPAPARTLRRRRPFVCVLRLSHTKVTLGQSA